MKKNLTVLIVIIFILGSSYYARDVHYNQRMELNRGIYPSEEEAISAGYIKMKPSESIFHQIGEGNENNKKYVSEDGKYEAVYTAEGDLVTSPVNMGTYNFIPARKSSLGHFIVDVLPYYIWGNSPDDTTSILQRVRVTINMFD